MPTDPASDTSARRARLRAISEAYFAGLAKRDMSAVPYDDEIVLRSPLATPGLAIPYERYPLEGKPAVLAWFAGLYSLLSTTTIVEHYFNEDLTVIATRSDVGIASPPCTLRVVDRFRVSADGRIVEQENHYDLRPALAGAETGPAGPAAVLASHFRGTYDRVLRLVDDLSDGQLSWRPGPASRSIGWNLWHLGRWTDHLQASIPSMTDALAERLGAGRQVWDSEELAARWSLESDQLGEHETGMLMADDAATRVVLPARDALFDYVRLAFAAAERAVGAIDDVELTRPNALEGAGVASSRARVGDAVTAHLEHNSRHLGEITCLRGLLGLRGTATR
jgi:hypothetical protein